MVPNLIVHPIFRSESDLKVQFKRYLLAKRGTQAPYVNGVVYYSTRCSRELTQSGADRLALPHADYWRGFRFYFLH